RMHQPEGTLKQWPALKLLLPTIPPPPRPYLARPIARGISAAVINKLIDPNLNTALAFMEAHLATHEWFSGANLSMADFQMSFAVDAALSRVAKGKHYPKLRDFKKRMESRPAYQRALEKGGPTLADFQVKQ
ncbi:MAG: glutathione binding-like protein, partial [Burkholderiales bacterium]